MKKLFVHPNLYVALSPIHGYGVFSDSFIPANTVIEECHFIDVCDIKETNKACIRYRFCYPMKDPVKTVLPLGMGCIYNHSNTANAMWYIDFEKNVFIFKTIKNIFANQEVCTYYGDENYWKSTNN